MNGKKKQKIVKWNLSEICSLMSSVSKIRVSQLGLLCVKYSRHGPTLLLFLWGQVPHEVLALPDKKQNHFMDLTIGVNRTFEAEKCTHRFSWGSFTSRLSFVTTVSSTATWSTVTLVSSVTLQDKRWTFEYPFAGFATYTEVQPMH